MKLEKVKNLIAEWKSQTFGRLQEYCITMINDFQICYYVINSFVLTNCLGDKNDQSNREN